MAAAVSRSASANSRCVMLRLIQPRILDRDGGFNAQHGSTSARRRRQTRAAPRSARSRRQNAVRRYGRARRASARISAGMPSGHGISAVANREYNDDLASARHADVMPAQLHEFIAHIVPGHGRVRSPHRRVSVSSSTRAAGHIGLGNDLAGRGDDQLQHVIEIKCLVQARGRWRPSLRSRASAAASVDAAAHCRWRWPPSCPPIPTAADRRR